MLGLQRGAGATLHTQLEGRLRELIRSGRLTPGARLPSSRGLAESLEVSRGIVLEAYAQLVAEGYLTSSQGAPTRVAATPSVELPPLRATSLVGPSRTQLPPNVPDVISFPRESWLRSLRAAVHEAPLRAVEEPDPRGVPELRDALMDYLVRVRAAAPEPEHTLITGGFTHAFGIVCASLAARGVESIAVESPGWPRHALVAEHAGLRPVPVPVDASGLVVTELVGSDCEAVVVTPAHQYPTAVVLSPERRAELLEWAEARDGLILEDDYDSELRYDRVAVGALQGLAPERVCHVGSVSKRLAPGLRLAWMLSPSWLTGALTFELAVAGASPPVFEQLALADFIARGELDRHLRRMRGRYLASREQLLGALARAIPAARVGGIAAGLFLPVTLPERGGAGRNGPVRMLLVGEPVGRDSIERSGDTPEDGPRIDLLLGFAGFSASAIAEGVDELSAAL